ncbi:MAG: hypothetical protein KAI41_06765 [Hyphomicrobiaceae bacterium]|nr:hypothetical protein [Hyphomicrobiaceae bacterium]MCK5495496.1 hypothetical protein [Hyphomicrobiaceae bacterium]MCK5550216.1 hypothetical protein [Hyphomicrobiaceae bacterium]
MAIATGAAASRVDLTIQAGALFSVVVPDVDTGNTSSSKFEIRTRDGRVLLSIAQGAPVTIGFLRFEATDVETAALRARFGDFPAFYDVRVRYTDASYDRLQEGAIGLSYGVSE